MTTFITRTCSKPPALIASLLEYFDVKPVRETDTHVFSRWRFRDTTYSVTTLGPFQWNTSTSCVGYELEGDNPDITLLWTGSDQDRVKETKQQLLEFENRICDRNIGIDTITHFVAEDDEVELHNQLGFTRLKTEAYGIRMRKEVECGIVKQRLSEMMSDV